MNEKRLKDYDRKIKNYISSLNNYTIDNNNNTENLNPSFVQTTKSIQTALKSHLDSSSIERTTKKKIKSHKIVPYQKLEPILATYETALEDQNAYIAQTEDDVDKLTGLMECLIEENAKLLERHRGTTEEFRDFAHKAG